MKIFSRSFFDFVSASDKRNADLTLKLMEEFGNILNDIKTEGIFVSKIICEGLK